jgi:response regulator of citrate/malate metabolism
MEQPTKAVKKKDGITWVKLAARHLDDCKVYAKVEPEKIILLDRIFEAHAGLGIVSTIDGKTGDVVIHVTPDTRQEVLELIQHLPMEITVLEKPPEVE